MLIIGFCNSPCGLLLTRSGTKRIAHGKEDKGKRRKTGPNILRKYFTQNVFAIRKCLAEVKTLVLAQSEE